MKAPLTPKTVAGAQLLLEKFAELDGRVAVIEQERTAAIARTNALADGQLAPIMQELTQIRDALKPWWMSPAANPLRDGKRKSAELGGCMIGTATSRAKLELAGDEAAALALLDERRWSKVYVRLTPTIDKVAIGAALRGGKHKAGLAELGFRISAPDETFFVKRVTQGGTIAP